MVTAAPRWQNWAGNQTAAPRRVLTPRSAEELAEAVTGAARDGLTVRMTGSGHSFTPVAVTDGVLLRPDGLRGVRSVDAAAGQVTVASGLPAAGAQRVPAHATGWPCRTWVTSRSRPWPGPSRPAPTAPGGTWAASPRR